MSQLARSSQIAGVLLLVLATGFAGQSTAGQGATPRGRARATYNDTLKRLFDDLARARTAEEMRGARSRGRNGFLMAVSQEPTYPRPYYNLGVLAEADEEWDAARRYFEQFRQLDGGSELSLKAQRKVEYLRTLRETDRTPDGRRRRQYEQALAQANALVNLGLLKEANTTAGRAAQLDGTRWEAYALIGNTLASQQLCADAVGFFQKAVVRAPNGVKPGLFKALRVCEVNKGGTNKGG